MLGGRERVRVARLISSRTSNHVVFEFTVVFCSLNFQAKESRNYVHTTRQLLAPFRKKYVDNSLISLIHAFQYKTLTTLVNISCPFVRSILSEWSRRKLTTSLWTPFASINKCTKFINATFKQFAIWNLSFFARLPCAKQRNILTYCKVCPKSADFFAIQLAKMWSWSKANDF